MNTKIYRIVPVSRERSSRELLESIHQAIQSLAGPLVIARFVYIGGAK